MTIDDLARASQNQFTEVQNQLGEIKDFMPTKSDLAALETKMATRVELAALDAKVDAAVQDLKSAMASSREQTVEDIKSFLYPHIRSLDTVLVDVEQLKTRLGKVEQKLGIG